jgi:hypothetical protein
LAVRDGERGTQTASIDARHGHGAAVAIGAGDALFGCVETLKVYIIDLIASAYSMSASACWWHGHDMSFDEHST